MYERPTILEHDLTTTTACCSPSRECNSNGGVWLGLGNATDAVYLPNCLNWETANAAVDGWMEYAQRNAGCAASGHTCAGLPYEVRIEPA